MNTPSTKTIILALSILLACSSCDVYDWNQNRIQASSDIVNETRNVSDYSQVKVCCSIETEIFQSNSYSMEISGPDNVLPHLETEVSGDKLNIGFEQGYNFNMNGNRVRVRIGMPQLTGVQSSSSSDAIVGDFSGQDLHLQASSSGEIDFNSFNGSDIRMEASSSGKINLNCRGSNLQAASSSSGRIEISGEAESIQAEASSSGRILAAECQVNTARVSAGSSGRIELHVLKELEANARSSGDVYYHGQPDILHTETSSSGKVRRRN